MTADQKLDTIIAHINQTAIYPSVIMMPEKDWRELYDYCQKQMLVLANIIEVSCVLWPVIKNIPVYFSDNVASFMLLCECPSKPQQSFNQQPSTINNE
jgi:hypothetical protein